MLDLLQPVGKDLAVLAQATSSPEQAAVAAGRVGARLLEVGAAGRGGGSKDGSKDASRGQLGAKDRGQLRRGLRGILSGMARAAEACRVAKVGNGGGGGVADRKAGVSGAHLGRGDAGTGAVSLVGIERERKGLPGLDLVARLGAVHGGGSTRA